MICSWYRVLLILKRLLWRVNWNLSWMNGRISDPCILQCRSSCLLEFDLEPLCLPRNVTRESKFFSQQQLTIDDETKTFLAKGVIGSSVSEPSKVESPFFAGRKGNLKFRVFWSSLVILLPDTSLRWLRWNPPWNWWVRAITWLQYTCKMHTIEAIPIAAELRKYFSLF